MEIEQILSQRGNKKFAYEGHLFVFDKFSKSDNNIQFWRCDQGSRCNARIHTKFGAVIKEVNKHSHNSSAASVEVAKLHTALKRRAEDTVEKPSAVISEVLTNVSQATLGSLPDASAMRKTIKRKRRAVNAPPSVSCRSSRVRVAAPVQNLHSRGGKRRKFPDRR